MLTVAHVYPEALSTYGDSGNVEVLRQRLAWRGIPSEVQTVAIGEGLPRRTAVVLVGGGEDDAQARLGPGLNALLAPGVTDGVVVLGVCAGLQLLGQSLQTSRGDTVPGAGLLDLSTVSGRRRAVGEVIARPVQLPLPRLSGFVNHGGVTALGPMARPLAKVTRGPANHPLNRHEGAVQGRVFGTYLHGPVLARNPAFADHLLQLAVGHPLEPLPDLEVARLRRERLRSPFACRSGRS